MVMTVQTEATVSNGLAIRAGHVTIHYRTGWPKAYLHYTADSGTTWQTAPFLTKRISPVGPDFRVGFVELPHCGNPSADGGVQFVLTDGLGSWDNPAANCHPDFVHNGTNNYRVSAPGVYVLYEGSLSRHDRRVLKTPSLALVTDIDGTLHGDENGLKRFYDLWCRHLALSGAFLIFNTGRSLESVLELLKEHRKIMPVPVAVVTRVGSFIHWFRPIDGHCTELSHTLLAAQSVSEWIDVELMHPELDSSWRESLSGVTGWDQAKCRHALHNAIVKGAPALRGHWLDDGVLSQNPFQLAVVVRTDALQGVLEELKASLDGHPVKYIVSGEGDYRYLDLAITSAGKLGASLHVTKKLPGEAGSLTHVVFCGDSGNDADALQGDVKGVVVANAQPDLLKAIQIATVEFLRSPDKFRVVKAEHVCADGIIHGLKLHGFL
jgi:hydroxymethylpyrimidine pyrophosphatase-like HAD family hydrolase